MSEKIEKQKKSPARLAIGPKIDDRPANPAGIPIEKGMALGLGVPEDAYECRIISIIEQIKTNNISRKQEMGAIFTFEIIDGLYTGKTFTQFFTNKLTKRSKLTNLCRGIWGDEFSPEENTQLETMLDLPRFLINKPVKVVLLTRHSYFTDTVWYDVAFFLKSEFYDEKANKLILPKEELSQAPIQSTV